jgi:hypothetical protein
MEKNWFQRSRHFRKEKREYLKDGSNELTRHSKNKNIRDFCREVNEFKKDYQPTTNLVKDGNCDQLADSHSILNRSKNYFSRLSIVHIVSNIR